MAVIANPYCILQRRSKSVGDKRAAKTEQTTVRRFFSEVALRWLAYCGGGGGVVTESLPKAPPWHPKVMLMTLEAHYRSTGLTCML
jgi:hypothetical protein